MARRLQRPVREGVTPLVLEKIVWAGANLGSDQQAVDALQMLAEMTLAPKQVQRITSQVGADAVEERAPQLERHRRRPLMKRVAARPGMEPSEWAVVMTDGGRFQRRDHFPQRQDTAPTATEPAPAGTASKTTHWREDKVGSVLSMPRMSSPAVKAPTAWAGAWNGRRENEGFRRPDVRHL